MMTKSFIICVALSICLCGCEQPQTKPLNTEQCISRIEAYGPATLEIVGLSELKAVAGEEDAAKLKIFVKALDSCGSAIKAPCAFRFELYEYAARSQSPLGKRLEIWPDIDLTDSAKNNDQWRDYLRAYEFNFDVTSSLKFGSVYVVEVTCLSPLGKRMSAQYKLSYQK
jgi:hypothetical protein